MREVRALATALISTGLIGVLFAAVVIPRADAQQPSGWLVSPHLALEPVITGLKEPTYVAWPPDGSQRAFVLERGGQVRVAGPDGQLRPTPFLDLSQTVSLGNEEGLLGLASPLVCANPNLRVFS
jgi:hypothetical protein